MLTDLHVKNLALIDEAEVSFGSGLNILTGETGAGKSVLLGAVNLALGQKFSKEMLRDGADDALAELIFQVDSPEAEKRLREMEIEPEDGQVIFTRRIRGGRSINRINGETCTVAQLKKAAALLMDIHGQHEHQSLLYQEKQLEIVDQTGGAVLETLRTETARQYARCQALEKELETYQIDGQTREREIAFLTYEIDEIDGAALTDGEEEALEKQYRRMSNSRRIADALNQVYGLTGAGDGAGERISRALRELSPVSEFDAEIAGFEQTLTDTESILSEFNHAVASYLSSFVFSEEEFRETEERLDLIRHLESKYGRTIADVLICRDEKVRRLDTLQHFETRRAELEAEAAKQDRLLEACAKKLTEARKESAAMLEQAVRRELSELNFLSNAFEIGFEKAARCGRNGQDIVTWKISTNPGEPMKPLGSVASGGELSRIMLAIRTIMAERGGTGTLIFDEIDAGISGRTAQLVSEKMARIARHHQVICITHLAQIAAMADTHFLIEKKVDSGNTYTRIRRLDASGSSDELARILGGAEITDATRESAREMMRLARERK